MSGEITRERVIVSRRLLIPNSCCRDFNQKALGFKHAVNLSASLPRLQADLAVKALGSGMLMKQDEGNTDNKKREFTGENMPGVESDDFGYRWRPNAKYEEGAELVLTPSMASMRGMDNRPNFGWITEKDKNPSLSFEESLEKIRRRPHVQVSKYRVDPRTDDVDPSSQQIVDPFALAAGLTAEERKRRLQVGKNIEEKALGRTIGSSVPGGSLIARAAAAIGILRDENNKFRCPPGTPAANQFTDATGSNCFGFSASRFARFTARQAAEMSQQGEMGEFRNTAKKVLDFLWTGRMFTGEEDRDPARAGRSPWYDAVTGERVDTPDWRDVDGPENTRFTRNGMINAQDIIARDEAEIQELYGDLGVDTSDIRRETNEDVEEAYAILRTMAQQGDPRGWDVALVGVADGQEARMTPAQVEQFVKARLENIPGWGRLTKEEQDVMLKADIKRYYETERAFLESLLLQHKRDPATAKFLGVIQYDMGTDDEAGFGVIKESPKLVEVVDPVTGKISKRRIPGEFRGKMHMNMDMIMSNQETMLPSMGPNERLALSVVGAGSTPQAQSRLAHFMLNSDLAARHTAGLVDGPKSFTRHIAIHEYGHLLQSQAFIGEVQRRIAAGNFEIAAFDKRGNFAGMQQVTDIGQLSSSDIMGIMTGTADGINLDELGSVLERLDGVVQFAGNYPKQIDKVQDRERWALEATAELYALREQGLISGDDVDSVLEYMDSAKAANAAASRAIATSRFDPDDPDDAVSPVPGVADDLTPEELAAEADAARVREVQRMRSMIDDFKTEYKELNQDDMFARAAEVAANIEDIESNIKLLEGIESNPDLTPEEKQRLIDFRDRNIGILKDELDLEKKKYEEAKKIWKSKYGLGGREESKRFDDAVYKAREDGGLLSQEEVSRVARENYLNDLRSGVDKMTDNEVIRSLADRQVFMKEARGNRDEILKRAEEFDIIKNAYIDKLRARGDKRSRTKISNEIDEMVEARNRPKQKPAMKFRSADAADEYVKRRRVVQSGKLTKKQREAIKQTKDIDDVEINQALDAAQTLQSIDVVQKRNQRLKRNGINVDETSIDEAPIEKQIENVLIPLMEAMDGSRVYEPVEIETTIEVDPKSVGGRSVGKEIEIDKFVSGQLMPRGKRKPPLSREEAADAPEGKKKVRVILSVKDGDRGIFTPRGDDGEYKLVLPPGSFRVVSRDEDGTIRIEVSSQKNTEEVLDSLHSNVVNGIGDEKKRKQISNKIKPVIDNYITERRESGDAMPGSRSAADREIAETSRQVTNDAIDAGSTIGEGIDVPYEKDELSGRPSGDKSSDTATLRELLDLIESEPELTGGGATPTTPEAAPQPSGQTPAPARLPDGSPENRGTYVYKKRRSKIREQLENGSMSRSDIEYEIDLIHRTAIGDTEWNEAVPVFEADMVAKRLFGTDAEIKNLTHEQISELATELRNMAGALRGSSDSTKRNRSQTLSRFASRLDDLSDLLYTKDNGYNFPRGGDSWLGDLSSGALPRSGSLSSGKTLYGPRQTRLARKESRRQIVSSHVGELRDVLSGRGSKMFPELSRDSIDPRVAELIKTLPEEEIYSRIEQAAYKFHAGLDRRVRVRMREADVDNMLVNGTVRSNLAESAMSTNPLGRRVRRRISNSGVSRTPDRDYSGALSSGKVNNRSVKKAFAERIANVAMNKIIERMDLDEEETEVMELIVDTAVGMRKGPQAALTKLGIELSKRGSRELADFVLQKLQEDGKITDSQAKFVVSKLDDVLPEDLPDPIVDAISAGARAARRVVDTPENRRRVTQTAEAINDSIDSARGAVAERARNISEAGAERMRRVRARLRRVEPVNNIGETGPPINIPAAEGLRGQPAPTLSSGRVNVPKTFKPGDFKPENKSKIKSTTDSSRFGSSWVDEIEVYDVGGKKVAFGIPEGHEWEQDISDVEVLPVNPYVISGLDPTSKEGRALAQDFAYAEIGRQETGSESTSEVSALLYAASRGDEDAKQKFNELVQSGREKVERQNADIDKDRNETVARLKKQREEYVQMVRQQRPDATEEEIKEITKPSQLNGYSGLSVDDLFLVHETKYEPEYDEDGNIILRPNGDYPTVDENGAPVLDSQGRVWDTYRGTLHFTINHRVAGHDKRESPEESHVIMIPLRDVLDANPDSLDNLFGIDTFLTPPPGQPLRLPNAQTIKLERGEEDPWGKVRTALEGMGMGPELSLPGGVEGTTFQADDAISGIAAELGVSSRMHFDTPFHQIESLRKHSNNSFPVSPGLFRNMSRAAIQRLLDTTRWGTAKSRTRDDGRASVA
jgi:hypothetical protein